MALLQGIKNLFGPLLMTWTARATAFHFFSFLCMLSTDYSLCIVPCVSQEEAIMSRWGLNVENEINVLNLKLLFIFQVPRVQLVFVPPLTIQ